MQFLSCVVPTRDRLRRQGRDVAERSKCGQCDMLDHWLAGCEHYPITEWLESRTPLDVGEPVDAMMHKSPPQAFGYPDLDAPACKTSMQTLGVSDRYERF